MPDRNSVTETFYYNTAIFSSLNSKEGRKQLLKTYKFKSKFTYTATSREEVQELKNTLMSIKNEVVMPVYSFAQQTRYSDTSTTNIKFHFNIRYFKVGDKIIISDHLIDGDLQGYFEITDVNYSQKTITIDRPVTLKIGTFVSWYKVGKLSTSISSNNALGIYEKFDLSFEEY
jgi:hypothetical protein